MPWRPRTDTRKLQRENRELARQLLRAKEDLIVSERRRGTLELVLNLRLARISELNGRLDALKERLTQPGDTTAAAAK